MLRKGEASDSSVFPQQNSLAGTQRNLLVICAEHIMLRRHIKASAFIQYKVLQLSP